jgi:hypothetical protein
VENRYAIAWPQYGLPAVMTNELWTQTLLALVTVAIVAGMLFTRRKAVWLVLLGPLVIVDGINAQPFQLTPRGLDSVTMPVAAAEPSVHARQLAAEVAPKHQRLLAIGSTSTDGIVPATWARIWSIPIAGGYGPMLLERHSLLATMGRNGGITNRALVNGDRGLDVLAVGEIMVKPADIESSGTLDIAGITWEKQPLDLSVGRSDCGFAYPRVLSLPVPADFDLAAVHASIYMRCAEDIPQGTEVGALTVVMADGRRHTRTLRAGVDVAESALTEPSVRERAKHQPVTAFPDPDAPSALHSLVSLQLPAPGRAVQIEISGAALGGWLNIGRLTYVDAHGGMRPQAMGPLFLADGRRWREVRRLRTWRSSDREHDEEAVDERDFTVYENRTAMPRAWLATEIRVLPLADVLPAIKTGQLPDGHVFDPATQALVAQEDGAPAPRAFGGTGDVRIDELTNGRARMTVSSTAGGFLVFSENAYRGWGASVDGQTTPVYRADYSIQGIVVPPGTHEVTFSFTPITMFVGGAFSLAALAAAGFLIVGRDPHGSRSDA